MRTEKSVKARERARIATAVMLAAQKARQERIESAAARYFDLEDVAEQLREKLDANEAQRAEVVGELVDEKLAVGAVADLLSVEVSVVRALRKKVAAPAKPAAATTDAVPVSGPLPRPGEQEGGEGWPVRA